MLLCKGRMKFTENSIFRLEFSICSSTFSLCLNCNKHDTSFNGSRGEVCGDSESNQMFCYVIFVLAFENMRGKKNLNFTPPHCSKCAVHSSILKFTLCQDRTKITPTESINVGKSQRGSI